MNDILKMDPAKRLTALGALRHPYFKGLNQEFLVNSKKSLGSERRLPKNSKSSRTISLDTK